MLPDLSAFWSTIAQVCVALGLALVLEANRIRKTWAESNKIARSIQGVITFGVALLTLYLFASALLWLGFSSVAIAAGERRLGWDPLASVATAVGGIFIIAGLLIVSPIISVLTSQSGAGILGNVRVVNDFFALRRALKSADRDLRLAIARAGYTALNLSQLEEEFRREGALSDLSSDREEALSDNLASQVQEIRRLAEVLRAAADMFERQFWRPKLLQIEDLDAALSAAAAQRLRSEERPKDPDAAAPNAEAGS